MSNLYTLKELRLANQEVDIRLREATKACQAPIDLEEEQLAQHETDFLLEKKVYILHELGRKAVYEEHPGYDTAA